MNFPWTKWALRRRRMIQRDHIDPDTHEQLCVFCWGLRSRGWSESNLAWEHAISEGLLSVDFSSTKDMIAFRQKQYFCSPCFSDRERRLPENYPDDDYSPLVRDHETCTDYQNHREKREAFRARVFNRSSLFLSRLMQGKLPRI